MATVEQIASILFDVVDDVGVVARVVVGCAQWLDTVRL